MNVSIDTLNQHLGNKCEVWCWLTDAHRMTTGFQEPMLRLTLDDGTGTVQAYLRGDLSDFDQVESRCNEIVNVVLIPRLPVSIGGCPLLRVQQTSPTY